MNIDVISLIAPSSVSDQPQIHIRIKQRNRTSYITSIEGIDVVKNDIKKMLAYMRKKFSCSGFIKNENEIHLSGDQRENVKKLLIEQKITEQQNIKIHGF